MPTVKRAQYNPDFWKAQLDAVETPDAVKEQQDALKALTPEKESGRITALSDKIEEMEKGLSSGKGDAVAFALMEAGMGIMGSKSQTLGGAIAEGGLPAIKNYRQAMGELRKDKRAMYALHSQVAGLQEARDTARQQQAATLGAANVAAKTGSNREKASIAMRAREADLKVRGLNIQAEIAERQQYVAMRGQDVNERLGNTGHAISWRKLNMDEGYRNKMIGIENDKVVLSAVAEQRAAQAAGDQKALQQAQIRNLDGRLRLVTNPEEAAGQMAQWFGNLPAATQSAYLRMKGLTNESEARLRKHFTETYQRAEKVISEHIDSIRELDPEDPRIATPEKEAMYRAQQIRTSFMTAKLAGSGGGLGAVVAAAGEKKKKPE